MAYNKGMKYKKDMMYGQEGTLSGAGLGDFAPKGYSMTEPDMANMTRKKMKKYRKGDMDYGMGYGSMY